MFSHLCRAALFVGGILELHGYARPTHHGTHFGECIQPLLQEKDIISLLHVLPKLEGKLPLL